MHPILLLLLLLVLLDALRADRIRLLTNPFACFKPISTTAYALDWNGSHRLRVRKGMLCHVLWRLVDDRLAVVEMSKGIAVASGHPTGQSCHFGGLLTKLIRGCYLSAVRLHTEDVTLLGYFRRGPLPQVASMAHQWLDILHYSILRRHGMVSIQTWGLSLCELV